ncbi:MAG TPA: hypothetical protein VMO52_05495 [Acidimicrobiia bacterium]|nr:hypothetical protein [Acidimicrobiia bacterium]
MSYILVGSAGLVALGVPGLVLSLLILSTYRHLPRRIPTNNLRPVLMVLLVELRGGRSVLASLQAAAVRFPDDERLTRLVRIAAVTGLAAAVDESRGSMRLLLAQLARAQVSGSSAADAVRRFLESDIARERARRLARMRALPVRLTVPLTLLILPGVVVLSYGPTILSLLEGLVVPLD